MSEELNTTPAAKTKGRKKPSRPALMAYILILFSVAFLLLLMSYFMQQRRTDQQVIEGLQQNASALQITRSIQEQNQTLRQQVADMEQTLATQTETHENAMQAMDWLWRIQREYFQRRYSSARQMIREFEDSGLKEFLPTESLTDPDYRSPLEQYESVYDALF